MRRASLLWVVLLLVAVAPAKAQQPVWVLLKPEAVRNGVVVTGVRARPVLDNDRAIPLSVIKKITATGAKVRFTSRWLQAVSVDADASALAKLKKLREVRAIRPVASLEPQSANASYRKRKLVDFDSVYYGPNWRAIKQLGIPAAHVIGFTGRGIRIAILDSGFDLAHEALVTRRVDAQKDFINNDGNVANEGFDPTGPLDQERHGTWVWSILGGFKPEKIVGPAFDAGFILAKVDVQQGGTAHVKADEDRWVAAVEWADSMGARIINSSLAYRDFLDAEVYPITALNGDVTPSARQVDEAARRGILIVNAIGDAGPDPQSLWTPADADSIISVGAADTVGQLARFANGRTSGTGPTADGRLKPEVVALGIRITGANSTDPVGYDNNLEGSSFSTPLIAGGAAMFMQAWPNLTIMAVRNALMLSGTRADFPDNNVGFGVPNISSAILFPEGLNTAGITGVNLQNVLTTVQPRFTWSAPLINDRMRPVRYRLEVATDPGFANVIYTDTITEAFSLVAKRPLKPAPSLWWRITAEAFPDIRRTTRVAGPFSVPPWVRLLTLDSPLNSVTDSVRPVFRWEALQAPAPSGPLSFDVQIIAAQSGVVVQTMTNVPPGEVQARDPLTPNIPYRWRVIARSAVLPTIADTVTSRGVFIVTTDDSPPATLLYQNFPNPFPHTGLGETTTHIWFDVNAPSVVELAVYDLRGRLIRQLIPAQPSCSKVTLPPGQYGRGEVDGDPCAILSWDGRDGRGNFVPRGVYILRLRAGGVDQIKKILFMPTQ